VSAARGWLVPALVTATAALGWLAASRLPRPDGALLVPESGAQWIRLDEPFSLFHHPVATRSTEFARRLVLATVPRPARLTVRGFRTAALFVNGRRVASAAGVYDLAAVLRPGANRLRVVVENDRGPPAALVHSDDLDLSTPQGWRARRLGGRWAPARVVADRPPFEAARALPSVPESVVRTLPYLIGFFLIGALGSGLLARHARASRLRWALMVGWGVLCANNVAKIPWDVGFDVWGHYEYIGFILEQGRLPLASDGWTMFHPPLFYLLAALPAALAAGRLEPETTLLLLRILPMLCGLAQIEIAYRSSRLAFPERNDLQAVGTAVGGFLPMNLYISQTVSNEPLSGCLTALGVYGCFRLLVRPPRRSFRRECAALGFVFGLALLTKTSAVVLIPAVLLSLLHRAAVLGLPPRERLLSSSAFVAVAGAMSGWYYAKNWLRFGTPFLGGWEPARGFLWWQDPGYRVPQDFFHFGESLVHPVFASLQGFWDGLYSTLWLDGQQNIVKLGHGGPAWNHEFMSSMAWLAIPLTIAGLAGVVRSVAQPSSAAGRMGRFSVVCLASMLAAMLWVFFSAPAYCAVKSSYALGLLPCIAVLTASGFAWVPRNALTRALVSGYLVSWLAFASIAYFAG